MIRHCRYFETLKTRRITSNFGRLTNVTDVASIENTVVPNNLPAIIRQIVREELARNGPSSTDRTVVDVCPVQDHEPLDYPQEYAAQNQRNFESQPTQQPQSTWARPRYPGSARLSNDPGYNRGSRTRNFSFGNQQSRQGQEVTGSLSRKDLLFIDAVLLGTVPDFAGVTFLVMTVSIP